MMRSLILARLPTLLARPVATAPVCRHMASLSEILGGKGATSQSVVVNHEAGKPGTAAAGDEVDPKSCGTPPAADDDDMEEEEMFVEADSSLGHDMAEWGGPRRGGRFPEPTRFGDWERQGRCSDF
eukprot:Nitzschia sp. Nitz4//scaffold36_size144017//97667//98283//NITZ4_003104-RA/size144017-snap-gene-0.197-mRNA-1//1//CDS//3329549510//7003//frame0